MSVNFTICKVFVIRLFRSLFRPKICTLLVLSKRDKSPSDTQNGTHSVPKTLFFPKVKWKILVLY